MSKQSKLTLLIMAAGMGSRYGGNKQVDGFGPSGETLMDYSLYDALQAGFDKVVFIVRDEIKSMVEDLFASKLTGRAESQCVVQSIDRLVPSTYLTPERKKPWGTGHAVLCAKEAIAAPFAVINADDFYGRKAFESLAHFLATAQAGHHAMVGYTLHRVLSAHGGVSRGIAEENDRQELVSLTEVTQIRQEGDRILAGQGGQTRTLSPQLRVSMNAWGFMPDVFPFIERTFSNFLQQPERTASAEFYIGSFVTEMIRLQQGHVHVIPGGETWFGVTYREDAQEVKDRIAALVREGHYPSRLW